MQFFSQRNLARMLIEEELGAAPLLIPIVAI